ncbi:hypothetical protein FRC09_012083 [Ceratobasidium sp. 395]|nr:hypothetical protein FRC09_012083 [Ceratobasidium sp. 395]
MIVRGVVVLLDLVMFSVLFRRKRATKQTDEVGKTDMQGGAASEGRSEDTLATVDKTTEENVPA